MPDLCMSENTFEANVRILLHVLHYETFMLNPSRRIAPTCVNGMVHVKCACIDTQSTGAIVIPKTDINYKANA